MIRDCTLVVAVCAALFASGASAAEGGDAQAGHNKAAMCQGCHGIDGYRMAFPEVYSVPRLGGQHPAYIVKALQAYKSGARGNPTMRAIATTLSEKDMAELAAYYGGTGHQDRGQMSSRQTRQHEANLDGLVGSAFTTGAGAADVEAGKKKATEVCAACHGAEGNSQAADFPRIAGQHADYLPRRSAITRPARARIPSWRGSRISSRRRTSRMCPRTTPRKKACSTSTDPRGTQR